MLCCLFLFLVTNTDSIDAIEPILPEMATIPAGPFIFGVLPNDASEPIIHRWDIPARIVDLPTFSIAIYETSTAEHRRFILDKGYADATFWSPEGNRFRAYYAEKIYDRYPDDDVPCTGISYYEAEAYCNWLAMKTGQPYRLPTEMEWEKAARGTDGRLFPWGNEWNPKYCNWNDDTDADLEPNGHIDGFRFTANKGSYPAGVSPYGCYDMAGNVSEWCTDWIGKRAKVQRGGHYWISSPRFFRTTFRSGVPPEVGMVFHAVTGFRIAKSP
jgi:formylglycine-generating enzyme required for sulfatase activity